MKCAKTAYDFDITVDKFGNTHIVAIVGPANFPDFEGTFTDPQYAIWGALGFNVFDFTPDSFGDMNLVFLANQETFRGNFGDQNQNNTFISADPWMQAS